MGFDMSLSYAGGRMSMNWLRNPFGLPIWIEYNVQRPDTDLPSLSTICNMWTYKESDNIDRKMFLKVVLSYKTGLEELQSGFFYFNFKEYRQFVEPNAHLMEKEVGFWGTDIKGLKFTKDEQTNRDLVKIPMDVYKMKYPISYSNISYYKKWFQELVDFAEKLQDESSKFYCDN